MGSEQGPDGGRKRLGRRAPLIGGGAALAGGVAAGWDELERMWWLLPGTEKPRKEGELDHAGAVWTAASRANWRRADRPTTTRWTGS